MFLPYDMPRTFSRSTFLLVLFITHKRGQIFNQRSDVSNILHAEET